MLSEAGAGKLDDGNIVIFSPSRRAFSFAFQPGVQYWMPSKEDVARCERHFVDFLKKEAPGLLQKLHSYKRQYVGIVMNAERIIYINLFCHDLGLDWKNQEVIVDDGGDCYLNIKVNLKTGICYDFVVNGVA